LGLHETPFKAPFVDPQTGYVTQPWVEWLLISQTDKLDLISSATAGNIAVFTSTGNIEDGEYSISDLTGLISSGDSEKEAQAYYFARYF